MKILRKREREREREPKTDREIETENCIYNIHLTNLTIIVLNPA